MLTAAAALQVLSELPPAPIDAALRKSLLGQGERPTRLVGGAGARPALDAVLRHAEALLAASEPPADLGLAELHDALAAVDSGAPESILTAEVLAWRTAFLLGLRLGGPLADQALLDRLDEAVLAEADRFYERLTPSDPAYSVLVRGLAEYRELASAAPSEQVVGRTPRWRSPYYGSTSDAVRSLRARLAEVGFPAAGEGDLRHFDTSLRQAFLAFQGRFGLEQNGLPTVETLDALARPLAERATEIGAALEHMRATRSRLRPDRLAVNIPAFELRHFVGDRLDSTHRVVVGSTSYQIDQAGGRAGLLNQTPTLHSQIEHLVLNPSWSVPQRIKEQELDRRAERNPNFYDRFDIWVDSRGVERVRQRPGPSNALGQVKFVFQGGDGIYLHDTPLKDGFDKRVRALSHGCVRVQDALGLARRILEVDGHPMPWSRAATILARRRETEVTLTRPLPIFIQYVTVGADEEGALRFYPDLYGWGVVRDTETVAGK
ncbi:MAG: L,D-transpeptidase family protein [Myxococcota bacterium]